MTKDMRKQEPFEDNKLVEYTADIVSSYLSNNRVESSSITHILHDVHHVLKKLSHDQNVPLQSDSDAIEKTITDDYIICLEDGKKLTLLKRHLRKYYDMSPDEYRKKWRLPADYPMVPPSYAQMRSTLAKNMRLGKNKLPEPTEA